MKQRLTNRQLEVYCFMQEFFKENDQLPTGHAVSSFIGATSTTASFRYFKVLEKKGWIERNAIGKHRFKREAKTHDIGAPA